MVKTKTKSCIQAQKIRQLLAKGKVEKATDKCQKLCRIRPKDPDVWSLFSKVCHAFGNDKDAINAALYALSLDAEHVDAHRNAGYAYMSIGQWQSAATHFHNIVEARPNDAVALYDFGNALNEQGAYAKALEWLNRAVAHKSNFLDAHMSLGVTLKHLGHLVQATDSFKTVLSIDPARLYAKLELGLCWQMLGEYDEALRIFDEILVEKSGHVSASAGKAYVHSRMGNHKQSYEVIYPLLKEDEPDPQILQVFGTIATKLGKTDEAIHCLNTFLASHAEDNANTSNLHLQLGRLYERKAKYSKAFGHFSAAKHRTAQGLNTDPYVNAMQAARKQFNKELFAGAPRSDNISELPVFIVGMPRSGTSLVEQIIASHSSVYGAGELPDLFETVARMRNNSPGMNNSDLLVPPLRKTDLEQEANQYLNKLINLASGATRVTDKMPHNFVLLGLIALLFPKARVIHCKRHPLDTCLSIFFNPFSSAHGYTNRLEDIGKHYREYVQLMNHWKQVLPLPFFEVQYEDLINHQATVSRQLINFCGLKWEDACLTFYKSDRSVATMSYDQVSKPVYSSSIGRWKFYEEHIGPLKTILDQVCSEHHAAIRKHP